MKEKTQTLCMLNLTSQLNLSYGRLIILYELYIYSHKHYHYDLSTCGPSYDIPGNELFR